MYVNYSFIFEFSGSSSQKLKRDKFPFFINLYMQYTATRI